MKQHQKFIRIGAVAFTATAIVLTSAVTPAQAATKSYTLAEVKAHNSSSNCWSAVNGKVYNLTKWVKKHRWCFRHYVHVWQRRLRRLQVPARDCRTAGKVADPIQDRHPGQGSASTDFHANANDNCRCDLEPCLGGTAQHGQRLLDHRQRQCLQRDRVDRPHKGGSGPIMAMCGIDASAAYNGTHGTASKPASTLNTFKVGAVGTAAP